MRATRALVAHAAAALSRILRFDAPADQLLSRYFREHRSLGQNDRAFVAETVFAVLRRKRSLEAAAQSSEPAALVAAALTRVLGLSARALEEVFDDNLLRTLKRYDRATDLVHLETLPSDTDFIFNNRYFIKGPKIRTRYRCREKRTNHIYLFAALAEVKKL